MKQELLDLINRVGEKQYSQAIRKDTGLLTRLVEETIAFPAEDFTIPERVSIVLYGQSPICEIGRRRKFKNIKTGFVNCGRAGVCECARKAVSDGCKSTLAARSQDDWVEINKKREATLLEQYGVSNVSQIDEVKQKRADTMLDRFGVASALSLDYFRVGGLKTKYGVENPQDLHWVRDKSKQTYEDRTGFDHPMHNPEVVERCHHNRDRTFRTRNSKLAISYENILSNLPDQVVPAFELFEYRGVHNTRKHYKYDWRCTSCDLVFTRTMAHFDDLKCPRCRPSSYQSQPERDIAEMIRSWGFEVIPSERSLINPFELDLVIPEKRLAIEYCGLYWHAESQGKTQTYHLNKLERCTNKGFQLITLFSDEWINSRPIVETRLRSILGHGERGVGARCLRIEEIPWINAKLFLDEHHIQGAGAPVGHRFGALDDGRLCAVMTFGRPRHDVELVRFATDGKSYAGIASRLMKAFVTMYEPSDIVSFADRRWSTGRLYRTLGFSYVGTSKPSYSYTRDYETREHKSNFRLDRLEQRYQIDRSLGERVAMIGLGYDRVWDCGNLKFLWNR